MEEILASIRRIIADDDAKPAKGPTGAPEPTPSAKQTAAPATPPPAPPAKPAALPTPKPVANSQDDIDAMLAELDDRRRRRRNRPHRSLPRPMCLI